VSSIEQKRASVQTTAARIELARSERQLAGARVELAATWGSLDPAFDHVTGELHTATALPSLNVLLERSAANPDLQRWQYEIARREAELDLAAARRIPDLTASLGFVTQGIEGRRSRSLGVAPNGPFFSQSSTRFDDSRDNRVEFEISIPLPIFDRNQGRIREAEYLRAKADDERHAAVVQVQSQITHWHETANVAYNEVAMLENLAIRDAKDAFEAMQIGFNEGKFGYLDVLDAQRTLFELESQLHDAYAAYHLAVVEVERLLGEPLWPAGEIFGTSIQENPDESN
jgi:cobalt-zinc-cadmium efflux system outer membrane protein